MHFNFCTGFSQGFKLLFALQMQTPRTEVRKEIQANLISHKIYSFVGWLHFDKINFSKEKCGHV